MRGNIREGHAATAAIWETQGYMVVMGGRSTECVSACAPVHECVRMGACVHVCACA